MIMYEIISRILTVFLFLYCAMSRICSFVIKYCLSLKFSGFRVGFSINVHRILDICINLPKLIPTFRCNPNKSSLQLLQHLPEADYLILMKDAVYPSESSEQRDNMAIILSLTAFCYHIYLKSKIAVRFCFNLELPHATDN
jgi:hypothetical protein